MAHPLTALFPLLAGDDYERLKNDIRQHGLREPILTYRGAIVDGRQRYRACRELEIEPQCREWDGTGPLLDLIVSLNLHRRHLSESQRGMIGARLAELYAAEEGEARGRRKKGADLRSLPPGKRAVRAARAMRVGARTVELARRVLRCGSSELISAVERSEIPVSVAAEATRLPARMQTELVRRGDRAVRDALRERSRAERLEIERVPVQPLSQFGTRFSVVYADPPWAYDHCASVSRRIENHYATMTLEEICALEVEKVVAADAVLFLWTTAPMLADAIEVMRAWGFKYRTGLVWDKLRIGLGYWARGQHEHLLVGTRGEFAPPPACARPASVVREARAEHSRKPERFRQIIEAMFPALPKLELFARGPAAPGWEVWGDQAIASVESAKDNGNNLGAPKPRDRAPSKKQRRVQTCRVNYSQWCAMARLRDREPPRVVLLC